MRDYFELTKDNVEQWLEKYRPAPAAQLTTENMSCLADNEYLVSPKADGEHSLFLCESGTNHLYLISQSFQPCRLEGNHRGLEKTKGFLLETEVVSFGYGDAKIVLVNDLCCIGSRYHPSDLGVRIMYEPRRYYCSDGGRCRAVYMIPSLRERRVLLELLVQSMAIPGLVLMPIFAAQNAEQLWKASWDNLPFRKNGLIFSPTPRSDNVPVLEWKPVSELTVDVAVGGVIEQTSSSSKFKTYLQTDEDCHIGTNAATAFSSPLDLVAPWHAAFRPVYLPVVPLRRSDLVLQRYSILSNEDYDGGIAFEYWEDVRQIEAERRNEAACWDIESLSCSGTDCPCEELLPCTSSARKIMHCCQCGALGVGEHSEDIFWCIEHEQEHSDRDNETSVSTACHVWIPNECAKWARHGVVEVYIAASGEASELRFKRLRCNKSFADSVSTANDILEYRRHPVQLSQLWFKEVESTHVQAQSIHLDFEKVSARSSFRQLRICSSGRGATNFLIDVKLPDSIEREVLAFFTIPDLLRGRLVSKKWHSAIDDYDVAEETRRSFFVNGNLIKYDSDSGVFYQVKWDRELRALPDTSKPLSVSSVALYLRMGGPPIPTSDESDESDSDDESDDDDFIEWDDDGPDYYEYWYHDDHEYEYMFDWENPYGYYGRRNY